MDSFMTRVAKVQAELKAPKNQYNTFGKYKYRSCEDILEAAKPLCVQHGIVLTVNDTVDLIGDRYYIRATATLHDTESDATLSNEASAREENEKKGMDAAQLSGATSSYARKYALNGLFSIDDTKDADTDEFTTQSAAKKPDTPKPAAKKQEIPKLTCYECHKVVIGYKGKDGAEITPEKHIAYTKRDFGKVLCLECARKANAEKQAAEKKAADAQ